MKRFFLLIVSSFFTLNFSAQIDTTFVDSNYFEDQFYFGFNYNALLKTPTNFVQNGISGSILVGYIRDIPLNERRNFGLGIGLGYGYNAYIQNMKIEEIDNVTQYSIIPTSEYKSNRFHSHTLEVPIEIRWRTSTPTKYNFWRIYTGIKFGYVFVANSKFEGASETIKVVGINEFEKLQYGLTFSVGYSSLNLNVYYGLNELFNEAYIESEKIELKQLSIGLIFYVL